MLSGYKRWAGIGMKQHEGEYVSLGCSGLKVSRLAFGLAFRGQKDAAEAERLINKAIDWGINFIDCSNIYALTTDLNLERSETILGRVLKSRRDEVVITSKVGSYFSKNEGPNKYGASRYHIMREVEKSLKRLNTDRIDVYFLHDPDPETPIEETCRTFETLVQQGKIRYCGLCNHQAWRVERTIGAQERINAQTAVTVQNAYSLLNRALEEEMFPLSRDRGLGIMAYSLLGVGLLSGAYKPGLVPSKKHLWGRDPLFQPSLQTILNGRTGNILAITEQIAERHRASVPQVATAWVLSHPEITVAISGANNEDQLVDSLGAIEIDLSDDDTCILDEVSKGMRMSLLKADLSKYHKNA
jgi:aryl-alcohol dehydrogenase-like predicted oxidoreductase